MKHGMNKIAAALIGFTVIPFFAYAEKKHSSAKSEPLQFEGNVVVTNFNDLDMVEFASEGVNFTIGQDSQTFTSERFLDRYSINRYETTYRLWYKVRTWAEANGYYFNNPGQEGSNGLRGKAPSQIKMWEPVTAISWYDAIVWCNAFSEMEGLTPCYTQDGKVLRDSSDTASCDLAECNWKCGGYRLPSEAEWEYAARKTPAGLQRGDLASGQINFNGISDENIPEEEVAWNSFVTNETHTVGTAGTPFDPSAPPNPGSGNPNGAGLFDMSGNILEFCWDWQADYKDGKKGVESFGPEFGAERIMRGGAWYDYTMFLGAGDRYSFDPNEAYNYFGFRICK